MSETAIVLIAAAVGFSVTELVCGPFLFRALINQRAVARWMLAGLAPWPQREMRWWERVLHYLNPRPELHRLCKVLGQQLAGATGNPHAGEARPTVDAELFQIATGGGQTALYRLESDQMAAQINAAAEAVLDQPRKHPLLLVTLAKLTPDEATTARAKRKEDTSTPPLDGNRAPRADVKGGVIARSRLLALESTINVDKTKHPALVSEARHEVTLRIQRRLDDLQITTRNHQQVLHQALYVVGGVAAAMALAVGQSGDSLDRAMILGAIGGFVAPIVQRLLKRGTA